MGADNPPPPGRRETRLTTAISSHTRIDTLPSMYTPPKAQNSPGWILF